MSDALQPIIFYIVLWLSHHVVHVVYDLVCAMLCSQCSINPYPANVENMLSS